MHRISFRLDIEVDIDFRFGSWSGSGVVIDRMEASED